MQRCGPLLCGLLIATGCGQSPSPQDTVTFHRDVAPLLVAHCASCHHAGGAAPFSLLTYADAKARASQIAEVTESRFMPPWLPKPGHVKFLAERRLTDEQIALLSHWSTSGAPEGDPREGPSVPQFAGEWQLGQPDLILESPEFDLPASGTDSFRNFVLPVAIDEARWVRAVELRPECPQVTHHMRLGIDRDGESARRDAADPEPGYEGMAWGADPEGQLITWTPGMHADEGTVDSAWRLVPDIGLVLHTHIQPSGKPEKVRFRVGLYFTDDVPTKRPIILRIGSRNIDIPPGEASFAASDEYTLPIDVDASYIFPHAHSLAREIVVNAELPGGETKTLIEINRFDENWHDTYRFAAPVRLPRGTRLRTRFMYDNSSANTRNPHNPPQRVVYGSNANDEMQDVYLQVIPVDPDQFAVLEEDHEQYELESKVTGYAKSLGLHPDDVWSHEALTSAWLKLRQPLKVADHWEQHHDLLAISHQAKLILASAQLALGKFVEPESLVREVIAQDDKLPLAWAVLGKILVFRQEMSAAEAAFRRAAELSPGLMQVRLELIDLLVSEERWQEALLECEAADFADHDSYLLHYKWANILAHEREYEPSLAHFNTARELGPFLSPPETSLAISCYQFGDEAKARELFHAAIRSNPSDALALSFLGQIARRDGDLPKAREDLSRALELSIPRTWPASHVRQFRTVVYAEQVELARQTGDVELLRSAVTAWLEVQPENKGLRSLLDDLNR